MTHRNNVWSGGLANRLGLQYGMIWPEILQSNLEINSITHISLLKEANADVSHYSDSRKEQNE